ncbi:MAG: DoxX family membrane protein [Candidatus Eisenbacteria bacterium]|nr:DoxX family membrane protein [Candidatus Eisenbacteria bacterium]
MTPVERRRKILAALSVPIRIYLGIVFIYAAIYKIAEPYDFALAVATYQVAPLVLVNIFAVILPWVELVTGVALIAGFWTKENATLILLMMILFIVVLSVVLGTGREMGCGCFASQEAAEEISWLTLARDFFWTALAAFLILFDDGRYGMDGLFRRRRLRHV